MAEPVQSSRVEKWFRFMAGGVSATAPPNLLDPEGGAPFVWRDSLNLLPRDGELRPRPGIPSADALNISGAIPYQLSGTLSDEETPVFIYWQALASSTSTFAVMVTNRQIFVNPGTGWINCTPTYAIGTVTATTGSPNITGAGAPLWVTRSITPNQHILLEGRWYRISAVTGESAITLTENYAGTGGPGLAYTIRRNFRGGRVPLSLSPLDLSEIYCVLYNQNLYVAGSSLGGASTTRIPAVIKVADIYTGAPTTSYLTADRALTAGLDAAFSSNTVVFGVRCLQDGRVVVFASGPEKQSRSYYSSHLNDAVWTVSPGGFDNITLLNGQGTGLSNIGSQLTYHYPSGIVFGNPTGLADPPLTFQRSGASAGCRCPRTLDGDGSHDYYVGPDGNGWIFDGAESTKLGSEELRYRLAQAGQETASNLPGLLTLGTLHGKYDAPTGQYFVFFQPDNHNTRFWVYDRDSQAWWPGRAGIPISAASNSLRERGGSTSDVPWTFTRFIVGVSSLDGSTEVAALARYFSEDSPDTKYTNGTAVAAYAESDDLDFGAPLTYKQIEKLVAAFKAIQDAGTDAPILSVSNDGGVTWTDKTLSVSLTSNIDKQLPKQASVLNEKAAAPRWRVKLSWAADDWPESLATQLVVVAHLGGMLEQVEL